MADTDILDNAQVRDSILRVYENFYWIHEWIIDVCARWALKQTDDIDKKLHLIQQAWEERNQMVAFKEEILALGYCWDELDHSSYLFEAMRTRYALFKTTEDELEVLVGMNLFSEGVFGVTELVELHGMSPKLFPRFPEFAREEMEHADGGKRALARLLAQQPELRPHARELVEKYRRALVDTATEPEFSKFLMQLVSQGLLPADVLQRALLRYNEVLGWV
jgi:hypothetical protein